jgi:tetratricopeptide (TPR) repeat protein
MDAVGRCAKVGKILLLLTAWISIPHSIQAHEHTGDIPTDVKLGKVSFPISCMPSVQGDFNHAVALLHSFWHSEAQRVFKKLAVSDPNCAMAYWGVAMSHFHLGLSWPAAADIELGRKALTKAEAAAEKDAREAAYIAALRDLYTDFKIDDSWKYFKSYADRLSKIAAMYPKDLEARVFEGLALILAQQPGDVNLTEMRQAVKVLQPLLQQYPDHPGIAHYLIHACDTPGLAQEGLEAARRYAKIAPAAPHALHMPSHIFTRLGLWREDIDSNLASKAAAENAHAGAENRLHAMEFLEYAYLQTGNDVKAYAMLDEAKTISQTDVDSRYGSYYPTVETRFPILYAIETQDWATAATVQSMSNEGGGRALALLAHAMAAGHLKDRALADATLQATKDWLKQRLNDKPLPQSGTPEAGFLDVIQAWADFTNGDLKGAEDFLNPVADREAQVGKGELDLPVREMLADMLWLDGMYKEARAEYQRSLKSNPNRFNALLRAGEAADQAGEHKVAQRYFKILLANCPSASGPAVQKLNHAKTILFNKR